MEMVSFMVCEATNLTQDGRVNVLGGGIKKVMAPAYPVPFGVTIMMQFEVQQPIDAGPHELEIVFADADGGKVGSPARLSFKILPGQELATIEARMGAQIPRSGRYQFQIAMNRQHIRSWTLEFAQAASGEQKSG